jgi:hypothetical protein
MALPFATSTITIIRSRLPDDEDPYDPPADWPDPNSQVVASGIRAVVGVPSVNPILTIGDRLVYTSRLQADPCDIQEGDTVIDNYGRMWEALGPTPFGAFMISGMQATLRLVEGLAQ